MTRSVARPSREGLRIQHRGWADRIQDVKAGQRAARSELWLDDLRNRREQKTALSAYDVHQLSPEDDSGAALEGQYDYGDGRTKGGADYMIFSHANELPAAEVSKWWFASSVAGGWSTRLQDYEAMPSE